MLLSIVIPTYNRSATLGQSLLSLKRCVTDLSEVEICVVDDNSRKTHRKINASLCGEYDVKYQYSSQRLGPAHARNSGLYATSGEWVAFLDDDVSIDNNWYTALKNAVLNASATDVGIEGVTRSTGNGLWDCEVENRSGGLFLTSNITYRREILMRCGGFDEAFTGPFAEDQELALRIKKWGDIFFEEKCIVYHQPRNINLLFYCLHSFTRMCSLLDAEFYFSAKHRDRYHTQRYAANFWEGFITMLFKHCLVTVKRRTIKTMLRHPLQAVALTCAALLEQCTAWLCVPKYLVLYAAGKPHLKLPAINKEKTAALWQFKTDTIPVVLRLKPSVLGSLFFRVRRKPVYNAVPLMEKLSRFHTADSPRIFLRIDDVFLNGGGRIDQFCSAMEQAKVPFLAAVTGDVFLDRTNIPGLEKIVRAGGAIALHGFRHKGTYGPYMSEILQLSFPELDRLNAAISEADLPKECKPVAFIPPFNAVSWEQILHLSRNYPIVCGGPETMRFTACCFGPVMLDTGAVYFPSCHPFYGHAADIVRPKTVAIVKSCRAPVCFTVHLQAEAVDAFSSLLKCVEVYRGSITDWRTLGTDSVTRHHNPPEGLFS